MYGKKVLIDIGTGLVLSDAIAAILRNPSKSDPPDTVIILKSGGHLPAARDYEELTAEVEDALQMVPLADYVPEIAQAMQGLQRTLTPAQESEGGKPHKGKSADKEVVADPKEKH